MRKVVRRLALTLLCGFSLSACSDRGIPLPREIVDLSPAITPDLTIKRLGSRALEFLGTAGRTRSTPVLPGDPAFAYGLDTLELLSHTGAHLDAPARLLRGGETPAHIRLTDLFGRARVVDLRWHNRHTPIQITDLEINPIEKGDIVILFVGYEPPTGREWPRFAPLSAQAAQYLVAKKIQALATDLPALSRFDEVASRLETGEPPERVWAEYLPLFQAQIPVIAGLVNLEAIANEPRVAFVGFPLPISFSHGAPMRAAALVY